MKNIYIQELILQLIFNLGLALTDSHTNQSRLRRTRSRPGQGQCFESSYIQKNARKLSEYLIVHYHWYRVSSIKGSGGSLRAGQRAN